MPTRYLSPDQIAQKKRKQNIFSRIVGLFSGKPRPKLPSSVATIVDSELHPTQVAAKKATKRTLLTITGAIFLCAVVALLAFSGIPVRLYKEAQKYLLPRGEMVVTSEFMPAEVIYNGTSLGTTPLTVNTLYAGEGTLLLKAKDNPENYFVELTIPVVISPSATTIVAAQVGPTQDGSSYSIVYSESLSSQKKEAVVVTAIPANADVYIDGSLVGKAPYIAEELTEGSHQVEIRASGYRSVTLEIQKQAGKKIIITSKLYRYITKDGGL